MKKKLILTTIFVILSLPAVHILGQNDTWFNKPIASDNWDFILAYSIIDVDNNGNVIIAGSTFSKVYPLENPFDLRTNFDFTRGFITKFSPTGEMLWSSYLGEGEVTRIVDFKIDESNNIIVTGQTSANTSEYYSSQDYYVGTADPYDGYNIFITNITSTGQVEWFTIIGGEQMDFSTALDLDSSQNIIIVGESASPTFPLINPLSTTRDGYNFSPIMLKIDSNGSITISTYLSYLDDFSPIDIDFDKENNLYLLGSKDRDDFYDDFILMKLNSSYSLMWTTDIFAGIDYLDNFNDMLVDNSSNVYLIGTIANEDYSYYEDYSNTHDYDQYLIKVNNTGSIEWEKRLGGINSEEGVCMTINSNQEIILGGSTYSKDYPVSIVNTSFHGGADFTTTKFLPDGSIEFSNVIGGDAYDKMNDLVYDEQQDRILALIISSTNEYRDRALMVVELSTTGELIHEISFAERVPLPTLITQILFLIIALIAGVGFLLFFTDYINKDTAGNAVITYKKEKKKGKKKSGLNFIERLSYCPNDNTKMVNRKERTMQTLEFTLTRNIDVSLQNAVAMKKIIPYAVQTITPIAEEIFNQNPELFDIQMVVLECKQCKFVGAAPKRLLQAETTGGALQIQYQEPERTVQFEKSKRLPNIRNMTKIFMQSLTLNSQKIRPLLQEKETIYLVYVILGVYTLVQTALPKIFEISTILIIIFEYFQNLIFMMVITYVIWRSDKKIQQSMASHEVLKLIGLSIITGIVFTILNILLLNLIPVGEIDSRLPLLLRFLPLGIMLLIFSYHISNYSNQSILAVILEVGVLGIITAVALTIVFSVVLAFIFVFSLFM
ncbi:MAG: hypothetical protein HeimC3_22520 [Candidatus Heimdallarchaeota archaeon LC_3]|nr:MAG: hypothetical protein HeimC3_22520 [Candidatus Heimdallarchaeota archaeon LC_3]